MPVRCSEGARKVLWMCFSLARGQGARRWGRARRRPALILGARAPVNKRQGRGGGVNKRQGRGGGVNESQGRGGGVNEQRTECSPPMAGSSCTSHEPGARGRMRGGCDGTQLEQSTCIREGIGRESGGDREGIGRGSGGDREGIGKASGGHREGSEGLSGAQRHSAALSGTRWQSRFNHAPRGARTRVGRWAGGGRPRGHCRERRSPRARRTPTGPPRGASW